MAVPQSIKSYLDKHNVAYETVHHRRDYTAQETAADTHTKGKDFAKTVLLYVDDDYCLVVIPAIYHIDMIKLRKELNAKSVSLATEEEIEQVCSDYEVGAMPPLGRMINLPVYVDKHLTEDEIITFNAGTHEDAIRMRYEDFKMLVKPKVVDIAWKHS